MKSLNGHIVVLDNIYKTNSKHVLNDSVDYKNILKKFDAEIFTTQPSIFS
jgi:hypothetical protein